MTRTCPFRSDGACSRSCALAVSPAPKEAWPSEWYCAVAVAALALVSRPVENAGGANGKLST